MPSPASEHIRALGKACDQVYPVHATPRTFYKSGVLLAEHYHRPVEFAAELPGDYADNPGVPARIENDYAWVGIVPVFLDLLHSVLQNSALYVLALLIDVVELAGGAVACRKIVAEHHFKRQRSVGDAAARIYAGPELKGYVNGRYVVSEGYAACLYQCLYACSAGGF